MDVKIIDGKNKLRPSHLKEFINTIKDENADIAVCITTVDGGNMNDLGTVKSSHFVEAFVNGEYVPYIQNDNDVVDFITDTVTLEIAGIDLIYWQETTRRKNSILKEFEQSNVQPKEVQKEQVEKPKSSETIRIGIATLTEEGLTDLVVSDGSKQAMVLWMNHHLVQRHILPKDQFVVFCLDYKDGDENNIELWKSLSELVAEKKIIMM